MANNESDDDRGKRIEELKRRVVELAGGELKTGELEPCPPDVEEGFWQHVVEYEEAPWTTHLQQLERAGVSMPAPETLTDREVTAKLWEVINKLAQLRIFLEETDHLSDRELYTTLWSDELREETKDVLLDQDSACHYQMLSSGSDEDNQLYLKYYADEKWRKDWHEEYPDDPMPDHEDPPYDRGRLLPQPHYGPPSDLPIN
ncbi:MAG: hypothetical protein ABSG32_19645 [Terriglobia bacterium]|jgi:hypothetical protein